MGYIPEHLAHLTSQEGIQASVISQQETRKPLEKQEAKISFIGEFVWALEPLFHNLIPTFASISWSHFGVLNMMSWNLREYIFISIYLPSKASRVVFMAVILFWPLSSP